jgi:hypothetical protein
MYIDFQYPVNDTIISEDNGDEEIQYETRSMIDWALAMDQPHPTRILNGLSIKLDGAGTTLDLYR